MPSRRCGIWAVLASTAIASAPRPNSPSSLPIPDWGPGGLTDLELERQAGIVPSIRLLLGVGCLEPSPQ